MNKVRKHVLGYGQCKTIAEPFRTKLLKRMQERRRWGVFAFSQKHRNLGGGSNAALWQKKEPSNSSRGRKRKTVRVHLGWWATTTLASQSSVSDVLVPRFARVCRISRVGAHARVDAPTAASFRPTITPRL